MRSLFVFLVLLPLAGLFMGSSARAIVEKPLVYDTIPSVPDTIPVPEHSEGEEPSHPEQEQTVPDTLPELSEEPERAEPFEPEAEETPEEDAAEVDRDVDGSVVPGEEQHSADAATEDEGREEKEVDRLPSYDAGDPTGSTIYNDTIVPQDTLAPLPEILFTPEAASAFIRDMLERDNVWRNQEDTLRQSMQLLDSHFQWPVDSARQVLADFPFEAVEVNQGYVFHYDTLPLRWLSEVDFIIDTVNMGREPFITEKTILVNTITTPVIADNDTLEDIPVQMDTLDIIQDTIMETYIDTLFLAEKQVQLYTLYADSLAPPLLSPESRKAIRFSADSSRVIISESRAVFMADEDSPFYIVAGDGAPDSLQIAVNTLLEHMEMRDSIKVFINDIKGQRTPMWLTTHEDEMKRFWVKNYANDSITLWIGNPSKFDIALVLEDNVNVERREKIIHHDAPIAPVSPSRALASLEKLDEIPIYWTYELENAFSLNQTFFSPYWARGGESSLASMLDIKAVANYNNRERKLRWNNNGRLRYGTIRTEEHGSRTNTDILEINSQFNTDLWKKVDFSTSFYGKTQVAKGYNYPNDEDVISRFLNPGTFTIGVGVEYKPFDKTTLNFSPLSYRNTFVLDTAGIDPTNHGIEAGERSRQELGGQLVIRNEVQVTEELKMGNNIRLFSGYLDKPQNVDIDWEMNLEQQISWFFSVRLSLHLIYDDDVMFTILDSDGEPVLLPDGSERKGPRTQFKQFLGLTMSFKL